MSEKYLELSKAIFNNNPYKHDCRTYSTLLKISKNNIDIYTYFYIHIDLKYKQCLFQLKSNSIYDFDGDDLTLYAKRDFGKLENFDKNKTDDENIRILSIYLKYCYEIIDNLTFYLSEAKFIDDIEYSITKLSKMTLDNENKKHYDGEDCCICYEKVKSKTKCNHYLCYFCIQKVNKCPICRYNLNDKFLKNAGFYKRFRNNEDSDEEDIEEDIEEDNEEDNKEDNN